MLGFKPLALTAAVATLLPSTLAIFDASANTNMAVYWGQGPNQKPLEFYCEDDNIDIFQIGFVNVFPDQSGGYPGTNFGNQCGPETYNNTNGSSSLLLSHCPGIGSNITHCQSIGKKILLSLGGASPNNSHLDSDASAVKFATFLWEAFGPQDPSKLTPRPFGEAVVDGFDLDIENFGPSDHLDTGYGTLVKTLRTLYETDKSKTYYVSAAPQCIVPDAHLADAIKTSPFDFLFIQFYNTPQCSARAYFDPLYGGTNTNISFTSWVNFVHDHSYNLNTKVYLGLPAAPSVPYEPEMYLQPNEAKEIIKALQCQYKQQFGGVMVYEATFSLNNQINGQPYADVLKGYLENTGCTVSAPVTSSATMLSTRAVSSTSAASTTHSVSTTRAASSFHTASSSVVVSSTQVASSVAVPSSSSSIAVSSPISTSFRQTSTSISTNHSSLSTGSSGSSALASGVSSGLYQNATSATASSAPASVVTSSTPTPVLSGTTSSPVLESTEYTSLTTYTTVTSCPVTTTQVKGGTTSIIVETSLITSTITTCPRCSEKTTSALVPAMSSSTLGSPSEVGTTAPPPATSSSALSSPSGVQKSSLSVIPAGQSSGPLPSSTTYTTTEIVGTLTTTCSEATTFSLSSSGRVYTATVNETLTISDCPCTVTHKTIGFSAPTNAGFPTGPLESGVLSTVSNANGFLTETPYFGTPDSSGAKKPPSGSEAGDSSSPQHAGSSSPSNESGSPTEGSHGSSSAGSSGPSNADSESKSSTESGVSSPGSETEAAVPQKSSLESSTPQGSQSEVEAAGSLSKAGAQALASGVTGAHVPVVTIEMIPVPESPSQTAQPGKVSQNEQPGVQESGQQSEQESGKIGQHTGIQSERNAQQAGQQSGQQAGQLSEQPGNSAPLSFSNGTASVSPSGTIPARPSGSAPVSPGSGNGGPAISSPVEFTGAASRVGGSVLGAIAAFAAMVLL